MSYAAKPTRTLTVIATRIGRLPFANLDEESRATLMSWTLRSLEMNPGDRAISLRMIADTLRKDAQVHDDADNMIKAALVRKVATDIDAVWQKAEARVEAMIGV